MTDEPSIAVTFLSDTTLNNALDGLGVDVDMVEGDTVGGVWVPFTRSAEHGEMFELREVISDELIMRGFVRNVLSVTVL